MIEVTVAETLEELQDAVFRGESGEQIIYDGKSYEIDKESIDQYAIEYGYSSLYNVGFDLQEFINWGSLKEIKGFTKDTNSK